MATKSAESIGIANKKANTPSILHVISTMIKDTKIVILGMSQLSYRFNSFNHGEELERRTAWMLIFWLTT